MQLNEKEIEVVAKAVEQADVLQELAELQLMLVGGGIGDTII